MNMDDYMRHLNRVISVNIYSNIIIFLVIY